MACAVAYQLRPKAAMSVTTWPASAISARLFDRSAPAISTARMKNEMKKATKVPFTAQEVEDAKSGWLQRQQVSRANDGELAGDLAQQAYNDRTMEWQANLEARVRDLTPEQVFAVMKKYIVPEKVSVVRAGDFEKPAAEPAESSSSSLVK